MQRRGGAGRRPGHQPGPGARGGPRLAVEGLLTGLPERGADVRELAPQKLRELYEVRTALESHALRLAPGRDRDGVSAAFRLSG